MKIVVVAVVCFLLYVQDIDGFTFDNENELRKSLFANDSYNVNIRPEKLVTVNVTLNVLTINILDIKDQRFKVSGWLSLHWNDQRLAWNKSEYNNIRFLFATESDVWRPAMIVSNSVEQLGIINDAYTPFRIENTGDIEWEPPGIYEVNCQADISYYPFDEQECYIQVQSWGYNLREVNVTYSEKGINLQEFRPNGEWDISESRSERADDEDARGNSFGKVLFYFKMRRKSQYYWLNVLLPVIVNSILTALVFALPAESGEKMGYSLTVLLSFVVLLTLVADKIPPTSTNTAIIVVYFSVVLILGALAVLLSTIVLHIYFYDANEPIPRWMTKMFEFLGKVLCYDGCKKRTFKNSVDSISPVPPMVVIPPATINSNNSSADSVKTEHLNCVGNNDSTRRSSWFEQKIIKQDLTWKDISRILDLFFLRFYLSTIILITLGFLISAYNHVGA